MARALTSAAGQRTEPSPIARLSPTQQRSRERFERILACAAQLIAEKGSDALRMSDIVERAQVPFGSLYQYFPDKTAIIGTLAERYNATGRACVEKELAQVRSAADLHPALCRMVDGFYRMYQEEPVMRDIWQATQADPALKQLDDEDCRYLASLLRDAVRRFSDRDDKTIATFAELTITLIAAAVRQAITLKPKQGRDMIALFKQMLPRDLRALQGL